MAHNEPTEAPCATLRHRPIGLGRASLVGALYLLLLVPLSFHPRMSGNVWSRYMAIESLVERGTWAVERSPLRRISGSPDLIKVGSHFYSDKPPALAALACPLYSALHASGLRFSSSAEQFVLVNWFLVCSVCGLSAAVIVIVVRLMLQAAPLALPLADLLSLALGLGTPVLTYAVTFNNHIVAAALMLTALWLHLSRDQGTTSPVRDLLAGFLAALAATIDLPAGAAWLVSLFLAILISRRAAPLWFVLGAAFPLLFHAALQYQVTGSPLPAELTPAVFEYEGSYWTTPEGRWVEPGPRWRFGLELLVGPQGWLTVMPILWLGMAGALHSIRRRSDPLRMCGLIVVGVVAVLLVYYTWGVRRTDFAGMSFGTRHLLAVTPPLYVFAVRLAARLGRVWLWSAFVVLLAIGTIYAWMGWIDPWSRVERRDDPALRIVGRLTLYPWSSYGR